MIFLYSNYSILSCHFTFPQFCNRITEKNLFQIIYPQQNLKKISLCLNDFPLYHSLLSLKNSNCTNTLRTVIFERINFANIVVLKEVFEQLNCLESIHIIRCFIDDSNFTQQIINSNLFMNRPITEPQLLLQKSGEYLENFGFGDEMTQELELLIEYCSSKIKFLKFSRFTTSETIY
jgi:hypothetical protein